MLKPTFVTGALAALALACGGGAKESKGGAAPAAGSAPVATATLEAKSGSRITGTAALTPLPDGSVELVVSVASATPGPHGVHIHATGDCSAPDATSAGPHFNPDNSAHGAPDHPPHHAGDLGNLEVAADGTGTLTIALRDVALDTSPRSLVGKAVVVHEKADDLSSQPAGNSGARVACGVIATTAK
jgi:Cu-Zn family superoxide dismutase